MSADQRAAVAAEAERILAFFESKGAERVEVDILQPSAQLLDLYGEDIRSRAYITRDAARNEMVLRPDFTVPVANHHMSNRKGPARYAYSGPVFRKQEPGSDKANEYLQSGIEYFGASDRAAADAEIFLVFRELLAASEARVATGDLGILLAAVEGLSVSDRRKSTLLRHIWRPARFRRLVEEYSNAAKVSKRRHELLVDAGCGKDLHRLVAGAGPVIGVRTTKEVIDRIRALDLDSMEEPLSGKEVEGLRDLLRIKGPMSAIPARLRHLSRQLPGLGRAAECLEARIDALSELGCDPSGLPFEASYGRTTLEYYDGFVFGWFSNASGETIASGGRYDLINEVLGSGRKCPAIGGVVRPAVLISAGRRAE
ncbi:MAG: ATP phosphoribosyltransferase regulatory subunit [Rhodobacteraceae bacterium]|nr:ATP phosphoribosyltransferase regulatory subunit [Paracoccaceae bacterium]